MTNGGTERTEEANQVSASARRFRLKKNGRSETAERRTETQFRREHEFAVGRLAGNWRFTFRNGQRLRQGGETPKAETEIGFGKNVVVRRGDERFERIADRIIVAGAVLGIRCRVVIRMCGSNFLLPGMVVGIPLKTFRGAKRQRAEPAQQRHRREQAKQRVQGCAA